MSLVYNGNVIATNSPQISISLAEYNSLPEEVKNNDNINFFIYDDGETNYERLLTLSTVIGSTSALSQYADGTIIGAINDIYQRLGGLSFAMDPNSNQIELTYSDENPNNVIQQFNDEVSIEEQISQLSQIVGDIESLPSTGFNTIISAIIDIYERLNDLSFAYNEDTNTVDVSEN